MQIFLYFLPHFCIIFIIRCLCVLVFGRVYRLFVARQSCKGCKLGRTSIHRHRLMSRRHMMWQIYNIFVIHIPTPCVLLSVGCDPWPWHPRQSSDLSVWRSCRIVVLFLVAPPACVAPCRCGLVRPVSAWPAPRSR